MKVSEIINEAPSFIQGLKNFSFKDFGKHLIGKDLGDVPSATTSKLTAQQAYQQFVDTLKKNNIPLSIEAVQQYLPNWAQRYILAGHDQADQKVIAQYIQSTAKNPNFQLPAQATPQMLPSVINDYLQGMIQLHNTVIAKIEKEQSLTTSATLHPTLQDVPAGYRVEVTGPESGGKYFKTGTQWTNELDQPVTNTASIQRLDALAQKSGQIKKISTEPTPLQARKVSRKRGQ